MTLRPRLLARLTILVLASIPLLTLADPQASADTAVVQRLSDVAEITQLRARLGNAIDNRKWNEMRDSLLTADVVTDIPASLVRGAQAQGRMRIEGSEATIEFMRGVLGDEPGGSHAVTTPMIEITSATAAIATWRLGTASYFDTYEKINGRWRVKGIRFEPQIPGPPRPRAPQNK